MIRLIILTLFLSSCLAYPYDDFYYSTTWKEAPKYPNSCCQLEWIDMTVSDPLPDDYVPAGEFMNRNWAYTRTMSPMVSFKSDNPFEEPNWIPTESGALLKPKTIPILSNPNKCILGWYQARFNKERLPINKNWFFPSLGNSKYGDFAKFNGTPTLTHSESGNVLSMTSLTASKYQKAEKYEVLYIDCKASIPSMSGAKLYNITYAQDDLKALKAEVSKIIYTSKIILNNSPLASKSRVKFEIETFDNASLKLSDSQFKYFNTSEDTYKEWTVGGSINFLSQIIGVTISAGKKDAKWTHDDSGSSESNSREIFKTTARRELFQFAQEVSVPAYSKTTVIAFSKPVKGEIPFKAIYELTPSGNRGVNTARVLEASLKTYGFDKTMERTKKGTILVHYDGTMNVDAGHEVDVDIQSVPLPGHSFPTTTLTAQTYRLKPNSE